MKHITLTISIISMSLILLFGFAELGSVAAQEDGNVPVVEETTPADLGVESPGLLPTNPFYFLKEWGRGIKMFFTTDKVAKIEYELKIANQKAAELKKVEELKPGNTEAIQKALENYVENMDRLRVRLQSLQETSENPNVDKLLDNLADRTLKHEQLFEELKEKHEQVRERTEQIQEKIDEVVSYAAEVIDNPERFRERLEQTIRIQKEAPDKEIGILRFINRIEERIGSEEILDKLDEIKEGQIQKFEDRVLDSNLQPKELNDLVERFLIQETERLRVVEGLREGIQNVDIKGRLEKVRERVMEKIEMPGTPGEEAGSEDNPEVCIELYDPVCGVDGKTYGNECKAKVEGVEVQYKGECGNKDGSLGPIEFKAVPKGIE